MGILEAQDLWPQAEGQDLSVPIPEQGNGALGAGSPKEPAHPKSGSRLEVSTQGTPSITSFALITTQANSVLAPVLDRMPVIIDPKDLDKWLNPRNQDLEKLNLLLKPYDPSKMSAYPVSTFVSNTRNEGPQCIEKLETNPLPNGPPLEENQTELW